MRFLYSFHLLPPLLPFRHQCCRILIDAIAHIRHAHIASVSVSMKYVHGFDAYPPQLVKYRQKRGKKVAKSFMQIEQYGYMLFPGDEKAWLPYNLCARVLNYVE